MKKILFIDDEEYILKTLERKLSKTEIQGFYATTGEEGFKLIEKEGIPVVFTDLMMPYMNGLRVVEEIHHRYPDVIVVVLSGNSQPSAILRTMNTNHVYKYLSKPWKLDEDAIDFIKSCLIEAEKRQLKKDNLEEGLLVEVGIAKRLKDYTQWLIMDKDRKVYASSDNNIAYLTKQFEGADYESIKSNIGPLRFYAHR